MESLKQRGCWGSHGAGKQEVSKQVPGIKDLGFPMGSSWIQDARSISISAVGFGEEGAGRRHLEAHCFVTTAWEELHVQGWFLPPSASFMKLPLAALGIIPFGWASFHSDGHHSHPKDGLFLCSCSWPRSNMMLHQLQGLLQSIPALPPLIAIAGVVSALGLCLI